MRRARRLSDNFLDSIQDYSKSEVLFYVDTEYVDDLYTLLMKEEGVRKVFFRIINRLRIGKVTSDLYKRERVSKKVNDVYAMRLRGYRIFCKEFTISNTKKIVMVTHIMKKTQKLSKKARAIIKRIGGYKYEFED